MKIASQPLLLTSRIFLNVLPLPPYFVTLAFPSFQSFLSLLPCTPKTSPWTSRLGFLVFPSIYDRLRYPIPARPFVTFFFPYSAIIYAWQPLFWHAPYFIPGTSIGEEGRRTNRERCEQRDDKGTERESEAKTKNKE